MTADEADQRTVLSRHTLARYMASGVTGDPSDLMRMVRDEISILEGIAEEHPGKAIKLAALVMQWIVFREGLKARMN